MASKNFSGILRDPLGTLANNDKYRFTHVSTTGEVIRGSTSYLTIGDDGVYDIDIEYGNVSIESYSELGKRWIAQGTTTINADTTATTLPALLNALVPASDALILQLEALLSDAESAADRAQAAADNLGTAAAADVTTSPTDTTAGRVLKVDDAYATDSLNYHSGNTNFNEFGGVGAGDYVGGVTRRNNNLARFFIQTSGWKSAPSSISVQGTFKIVNRGTFVTILSGVSGSDLILDSGSSNRELNINIANIDGSLIMEDVQYALATETATSKITVNF